MQHCNAVLGPLGLLLTSWVCQLKANAIRGPHDGAVVSDVVHSKHLHGAVNGDYRLPNERGVASVAVLHARALTTD